MHFAHEWIVNFMTGEWDGFESERRDRCRLLRRQRGDVAERHKREHDLALRIDIEERIYLVVHKTAYYLGGQTLRGADGQEVGEERAVVPTEVAVGAVLILPGIAPVSTGADDGERCVCAGGLVGGGLDPYNALIYGA